MTIRRRKHRGHRNRPIDRPMSTEKIEKRFEESLDSRPDYTMGSVPTLKTGTSCIYESNQRLTTRLPGCYEGNSR